MTDRQIYFDFSKTSPFTSTNDLTLQENEWSVVESLDNILTNEPGTLVYKKRNDGARLQQFLFDPIDSVTGYNILEEVENAISLFEPRAKNVEVIVTPLVDENTFRIDISCKIDESDRVLVLSNTLEKLR